MKNYNVILTETQQKYQHYHPEKLIKMNTLQAKLAYSPLQKTFEKQTKTIEEKGKKQIDPITDQNKGLEALTNKDDHKSIYKEIFDRVVKERFDEIKQLTHEIDHDGLMHYFKNNINKNVNDFRYRAFLKNAAWWNETRGCERSGKYIQIKSE